MGKLLDLEFRKNKRFISRTILIYIILVALAIFVEYRLGFESVFDIDIFSSGIFALGIFVFAFLLTFFILFANYKDYFINSAIMNFSLPVRPSSYLGAKFIYLIIFYLLNLGFLLILYKIMGFVISARLIYYFAIGLLWTLILSNIVILTMQVSRFNQSRKPVIRGILIGVVVFALGYLVCKYFSFVFVNDSIQRASPMDYAFVFPFAIGKYDLYINITPVIYYLIASLILFFVSSSNLKNKLDLS